MNDLLSKIEKKDSKIGIIGLGYVGLPLVSEFLSKGFEVIGIDKDQSKIDSLNNKKSYIAHVNSDFLFRYLSKSFSVSLKFKNSFAQIKISFKSEYSFEILAKFFLSTLLDDNSFSNTSCLEIISLTFSTGIMIYFLFNNSASFFSIRETI